MKTLPNNLISGVFCLIVCSCYGTRQHCVTDSIFHDQAGRKSYILEETPIDLNVDHDGKIPHNTPIWRKIQCKVKLGDTDRDEFVVINPVSGVEETNRIDANYFSSKGVFRLYIRYKTTIVTAMECSVKNVGVEVKSISMRKRVISNEELSETVKRFCTLFPHANEDKQTILIDEALANVALSPNSAALFLREADQLLKQECKSCLGHERKYMRLSDFVYYMESLSGKKDRLIRFAQEFPRMTYEGELTR